MDAKHNILVVDDEEVIRHATQRILTAEGFEVQTANDSESALSCMQLNTPDLVLVDVQLPGKSGLEFLETANRVYPQVLVIVITGYATANYAIASLRGGAFDYLPKPFAFGELLSPVRRACEYLELSVDERDRLSRLERADSHYLGLQAWARRDEDGSILLGLTDVLKETMGTVEDLVLPEPNDELHQGGLLARLTTEKNLSHVALATLSGKVLEPNPALAENPSLINQDPVGAGWIARITPVNLEDELTNLRSPRKR